MRRINRQHLPEQVIYLVIWLIVFLVPIVGDYYNAATSTKVTFNWSFVRVAWLMMLPFFLLFVANNYLLVPYLLFRKNMWHMHLLCLSLLFYFLVFIHTLPVS